jgi:hypothetical protein
LLYSAQRSAHFGKFAPQDDGLIDGGRILRTELKNVDD